MCTEILVVYGAERHYCDTVGELSKALRKKPKQVSADQFYAGCLCNAYLDKLGARKATDEEGFPHPEYIIEVSP